MRRLQTPLTLLAGTLLLAWVLRSAPAPLEFEPGCEGFGPTQANSMAAYQACNRERERIEREVRENPHELAAIQAFEALTDEYWRRAREEPFEAAEWLHHKLQGKSLKELVP